MTRLYPLLIVLLAVAHLQAATVEVRIENANGHPGQAGYVRAFCDSDIPLAGLQVPILIGRDQVRLDSISFSYSTVPSTFSRGVRVSESGRGLIAAIVPTIMEIVPTFRPTNDEIFRIHFTVDENAHGGSVVVDTFIVRYQLNSVVWWDQLESSDEYGMLLLPSFSPGEIFIVGDPEPPDPPEEEAPLPEEFSLDQNYPNPFRSVTRIGYSLPEAADMVVEVFDLLGRCVSKEHLAGVRSSSSSFQWINHDLPSGIYFYRLSSPFGSQTRKMTIVK